ncbi:MAG: DNA double-strand break repair nuclease NurA, partial [Candidatus Nanohaloarchaeota archaeon QJJ-7]|nr:DNA double-strand break repair nuclease NurA [Candidatus Nanohaloarchaeota archaeon QJJ-7]
MDIDSVVEEIKEREEERMEEAERLREELSNSSFPGRETGFIQEVSREPGEDLNVGGVDGGISQKEFHGVDVYIRRAVAAVFQYSEGSLESSSYIPGKNPSLETDYFPDNMDRRTAERLASLLRLEAEISVAETAAEETDLLLLDGSLVPQPGDRPSVDSELFERYEELIERYRELYSSGKEDARPVGVVEDARSSRICDVLEEAGLESAVLRNGRDSAFLNFLLEPGE